MKTPSRIYVDEHITSLDFDGPLDGAINELTGLKEKYGESHINLRINMSYDDYSPSFYLSGERLENNQEYQKRVKQLEKAKQKKKIEKADLEKSEREELARLKAKYEK